MKFSRFNHRRLNNNNNRNNNRHHGSSTSSSSIIMMTASSTGAATTTSLENNHYLHRPPPSSSLSLVDQFIEDARDDFHSPTTSVFFNRVNTYRQHAQVLYENLDFDSDGLQRFRKSVKTLNENGQIWHESEQELVSTLDALGSLNAANSLAHDCDPEISLAWSNFAVIFKDLSKLTKSLVQSVRNNLLFPVDNLLKTDLKDKAELKKPVDKAFRDFDAKVGRLEKELKHSSREGANGRLFLSSADLAESMLKERTVLELELCKFFHGVSKTQTKKGSELLQHLIAFYHTQESFYKEGLRTVEEFRCYVDTLINQLNDINRKQEEERKRLRTLTEMFETSPSIKEINEKTSKQSGQQQSMIHSMELPQGSTIGGRDHRSATLDFHHFPNGHHQDNGGGSGDHSRSDRSISISASEETCSGFLYKKSKRKMHRHWMKRKCEARNGRFYVWHSNDALPPQEINLLTCQVTPHKDEPKEFYIISYERKYHFQAEDESGARHWMKVLKRNQAVVQTRTFHSTEGAGSPLAEGSHESGTMASTTTSNRRSATIMEAMYSDQDVQKAIVERIRALPGNDRCCDCDSDKDISWVSTNLGSLHCIDCSGGHRDLGCHVSRIQSLTLDHLDNASVIVPLCMGNKAVNEIYEASPSAAREKLSRSSTGNLRKSYIAKKYGEKRFLRKLNDGGVGGNLETYFNKSVIAGDVKKTLHALALGVDVNCVFHGENIQESALFSAIRHNSNGSHLACVQLLIQNGADVNRANIDGQTPMHVCVRDKKSECLKLVLLSRNADLKLVQANLNELIDRNSGGGGEERNACAEVLSKALENDRSALADIELPAALLPVLTPRKQQPQQQQQLYVDSDGDSMTSSTMSISGNSPRLTIGHPPPPPPPSAKPRIPSLHGGDFQLSNVHRRSASDSSGGGALAGARMVLPPLPPQSAAIGGGNGEMMMKTFSTNQPTNVRISVDRPPEKVSSTIEEPPPPRPAPRKQLRNGSINIKLQKKCRALYDCQADQPDELSFRFNDAIVVTREQLPNEDSNWMEGYVESNPSKIGVFPVTFVTFET